LLHADKLTANMSQTCTFIQAYPLDIK